MNLHHLPARTARALAIAIGLLAGVGAAPAEAATPQDEYAAHVVHCQDEHGFDGTMNPGMHEGRSGWSPQHTC